MSDQTQSRQDQPSSDRAEQVESSSPGVSQPEGESTGASQRTDPQNYPEQAAAREVLGAEAASELDTFAVRQEGRSSNPYIQQSPREDYDTYVFDSDEPDSDEYVEVNPDEGEQSPIPGQSGPQLVRKRTENFGEASPQNVNKMKFGTSVFAMTTFILIVLFPPMTLEQVDCTDDKFQDYLSSHYSYFSHHPVFRNYLMIVLGALSDFLLLSHLVQWTYKGGSWRFIIAITMMYLLKWFFTFMFKMQFPKEDQWEYPGFYSLTIRYGNSNDYHFNTVLALCIMLFMEYRQNEQHSLKWVSLLALIGNFYMSTALKGHYFIDNYGGIVIGYYIWFVSNTWLSYYIDVKLFGMTIHERFSRLQTNCQKCGVEVNEWVQRKDINRLVRKKNPSKRYLKNLTNPDGSDYRALSGQPTSTTTTGGIELTDRNQTDATVDEITGDGPEIVHAASLGESKVNEGDADQIAAAH